MAARKRKTPERSREPKQARSQRTFERFLDAGERLMLERGVDDVSIDEIVQEAGSSVGGFYARFKNKDEFVRAVSERQGERDLEKLAFITAPELWDQVETAAMLRALLGWLVTQYASRRRVLAAALTAAARDPEAWAGSIALRRELGRRLVDLMLRRSDEMSHPDPKSAAVFIIQTVFAVVDERLIYEGHLEDSFDDAALKRELERLITGYLGMDLGPAPCD